MGLPITQQREIEGSTVESIGGILQGILGSVDSLTESERSLIERGLTVSDTGQGRAISLESIASKRVPLQLHALVLRELGIISQDEEPIDGLRELQDSFPETEPVMGVYPEARRAIWINRALRGELG